jgi:hypothetical protein
MRPFLAGFPHELRHPVIGCLFFSDEVITCIYPMPRPLRLAQAAIVPARGRTSDSPPMIEYLLQRWSLSLRDLLLPRQRGFCDVRAWRESRWGTVLAGTLRCRRPRLRAGGFAVTWRDPAGASAHSVESAQNPET